MSGLPFGVPSIAPTSFSNYSTTPEDKFKDPIEEGETLESLMIQKKILLHILKLVKLRQFDMI
jgi:hypothetical protein